MEMIGRTAVCAAGLACAIATWMLADIHYVSPTGGNIPPYTGTWSSAALTIQDAVDVAADGDTVLVTNGIYSSGGHVVSWQVVTNRVMITNDIVVRSVNGSAATVVQGGPGIRCVYMDAGIGVGLTLTNGNAVGSGDNGCGGGVYCASGGVLEGCFINGNVAGESGGGAYYAILSNCVVNGNSAVYEGGGVTERSSTSSAANGM